MASFWIVKDGKAMEHVGRPTKTETTSFAVGSTDEDYLAAGLFKHVNWEGTYDPRTQELSPPRFVVRSDLKEVQTHYDVWEKTPEQIAAYDAEEQAGLAGLAKINRTNAVEAIKVTTTAGNTFDGDEVSQGRMARAIIALQGTGTPTTTWVLADNTAVEVTVEELTEALALAGAAQTALWVIG